MSRLMLLLSLFRKGSAVANPEGWKNGQISVNMVAALLAAIAATASSFGHTLPVGDADIAAIAGGLYAVANIVVTIITSKHVGLAPLPPGPPRDLPALDRHEPAPYKLEPAPNAVPVSERSFPKDTGGGG